MSRPITHFDHATLIARMVSLGYSPLDCQSVDVCEMIIKAPKERSEALTR